jgi:hypothetical protein
MSCTVGLQIDEATQKQFAAFKQGGADSPQWLSMKLEGRDLNAVKLVATGERGASFDEFVAAAFPSSEARYCFFHFSYDLGLDGKRTKVSAGKAASLFCVFLRGGRGVGWRSQPHADGVLLVGAE